MPKVDFYMKKGDSRPYLVARLRESDGSPMDMAGVVAVQLTVQHVSSALFVVEDEPMIAHDLPDAAWRYEWTPGEMSRLGDHAAIVRIFWDDPLDPLADRQTVPTRGYIDIHVDPELP